MSTKKIPTVVNNEKAEGVSETPNIERQYADLVKKFVPMSYKEIGEEIRRLFPSFNPVQGFEHKIYNEVDEPFDRYESIYPIKSILTVQFGSGYHSNIVRTLLNI